MRKVIKKEEQENYITNEIYRVMKSANLKRMPSRSEIKIYTQCDALTNRIMKTGGFYYWADKLGLNIKNSDTKTGIEYEKKCLEFLQSKGVNAEMTPVKFPYDILIEKMVKVDVKVSKGYDGEFFFFTFNLESKLPKSDFYVAYCINERANKTLVIPSHLLYGVGQLSVGLKSRYDIYKDRWDLIARQLDFMKSIV